jgi:GntR family transcriptional repressor for pyruvate dehydrogenase complex
MHPSLVVRRAGRLRVPFIGRRTCLMTRQVARLAASIEADKPALLEPLRAGRNLTEGVVARIAGEIRAGNLAPGARLPSEQELMRSWGVSRTVVREAVAALRAEGLLTTRQGSGAFVAADGSRVPFRIDPEGLSSIADVLEVMELRLAIEVESAALAAQRTTATRLAPIAKALREIEAAIGRDEPAITEDFAFHCAIAAASGNPRFAAFLEYLGRHVIPRQSIRVGVGPPEVQRRYLERIQREHGRIYAAIRAGRAGSAREAMRAHLSRSIKRYRRIAETQAVSRRA